MDAFEPRKYVIQAVFILVGLAFIARLFFLQVVDESYKSQASDIGRKTIYPARGLVYDRHGKLIVSNAPIYELLVVQKQVKDIDTAKFCELLGITDSIFKERFRILKENKGNRFSPYKQEPFLSQIPSEVFAKFEEHLNEFPGFYTQVKIARNYPYNCAAHVLGDIGEVSPGEREASNYYYKLGEFIGKNGLEKFYEIPLRGKKGTEYYLRDHIGRNIGTLNKGEYDTMAVAGKGLYTTLDIELQQYGELLMQGKRGSIVAIEPSTGEILAFVSSPTYDPNMLVGRERGPNFQKLNADKANKPLINRPISAMYPPGSTFKPFMGLIAVNDGALEFNSGYPCGGAYVLGGLRVGCHRHTAITNLNVAIQHSCNAYFCNALKREIEYSGFKDPSDGLQHWVDHLYAMGMGKKLGIDLPGEKAGNIPTPEYYDKIYKGWRWKASTIISLGIGQGETTVTPLQLANSYAILANKGYYYIPHLAKKFENEEGELNRYKERHYTKVDTLLFYRILQGLEDVVRAGTARQAQIPGISVGGKTGTAENPHGKDHSIFAAFAPVENPKIAIAVVVENSGFGGTYAAPIASLMIEMYINREINEKRKALEERMIKANFLDLPEPVVLP